MDKLDLKPCPFCGGEAKIRAYYSPKQGNTVQISCLGCGILYSQGFIRMTAEKLMVVMTEKWNRRASHPVEEGQEARPVDLVAVRNLRICALHAIDAWRAWETSKSGPEALRAMERHRHEIGALENTLKFNEETLNLLLAASRSQEEGRGTQP